MPATSGLGNKCLAWVRAVGWGVRPCHPSEVEGSGHKWDTIQVSAGCLDFARHDKYGAGRGISARRRIACQRGWRCNSDNGGGALAPRWAGM